MIVCKRLLRNPGETRGFFLRRKYSRKALQSVMATYPQCGFCALVDFSCLEPSFCGLSVSRRQLSSGLTFRLRERNEVSIRNRSSFSGRLDDGYNYLNRRTFPGME